MQSEDLLETIEALGLEGERFALATRRGGQLVSACFDDVDAAAGWLGDSPVDCYITGNPVRAGTCGKPMEGDVQALRVLLVDCDPMKDAEDPEGTSQRRRDAAWTVASDIWEHFGQRGVLIDSGRGSQVWLRVEGGIDRRALLAWIREEFGDPLVEIDATHDASRLMRLPNTVNSRTQQPVAIVDEGVEAVVTRADVSELLETWAPPTQHAIPDADRTQPSPREIRRYLKGEALKLWREDPMEITTDRSRRDYIFLRELLARDAPLEVASRLLHALPGSKAAERGDESYWVSTATAALQARDDDEACADVVENVVARAEADPDYLLSTSTLRALARLYLQGRAEWAKMRAKLKPVARKHGLSILDVTKAVRDAAAQYADSEDVDPPDGLAIFTRPSAGSKGAWKVCDNNKRWTWVGLQEAKLALGALPDPETALRLAMANPWDVAVEPFKPRILPGRVWNESNARYAVQPEAGTHPTWDQLYRVVGRGLDDDLKNSEWAKKHRISTGGEYLRLWTGSMLQQPKTRRAYLFLFSPEQGTGKSLFFESHAYLIGKALCKANKALTNERFNGELSGAVLCYTEEVDLGANGRVSLYNRVKDYTLGSTMLLEAKGGQAYEVPNTTSWGQASNDQSYCPVYDGDDRITVFQVEPPRPHERMSKALMLDRLKAEAPAFLHTLLHMEIPDAEGRYVVPPILTAVKDMQARANRDDLADWLKQRPEWITMTNDEIVDAFRAWLEMRGLATRYWTPQRIRRGLPFTGSRTRGLWERLQRELVRDMTATEMKEAFGLRESPKKIGQALSNLQKVSKRITRRLLDGKHRWTINVTVDTVAKVQHT